MTTHIEPMARFRDYTAADIARARIEAGERGLIAGMAGTVLVQLVVVLALHFAGVL